MASISVFGLGYVGTVTAACLADAGHRVTGVDIDQGNVEAIVRGASPVNEKGLDEIVARTVGNGNLWATSDSVRAIGESNISFVCVGTPSRPDDGNVDLLAVARVCDEIGRALRGKPGYHVVAVRSTMLPGSCSSVVLPSLESASGKRAGRDFGVCVNPEFLREGSAVEDHLSPARIVIGDYEPQAGDRIAELFGEIRAPLFRVSIKLAEMTKYVDNTWHALKVAFGNEMGAICAAVGIDPDQAMSIFASDTKLNISAAYLTPGFAYGGPCLPKDLSALRCAAAAHGIDVPLLDAVSSSNARRIHAALDRVRATGGHRIGILGFAFKPGTDDVHESPYIILAALLLKEGFEVRLYDDHVAPGKMRERNRNFVLSHLPRFDALVVGSAAELADFADVMVLGSSAGPGIGRAGQIVIDLGRTARSEARLSTVDTGFRH